MVMPYMEGNLAEGNMLQELADLRYMVSALTARNIDVPTLSQISPDLGLVEAGGFIAGVGSPYAGDLYGVAILGDPVDVNGILYNLVGMNAGILQFGGSAIDGRFIAGSGNVILDAEGITMEIGSIGLGEPVTAITWKDGPTYWSSISGYNVGGRDEIYIEILQPGNNDANLWIDVLAAGSGLAELGIQVFDTYGGTSSLEMFGQGIQFDAGWFFFNTGWAEFVGDVIADDEVIHRFNNNNKVVQKVIYKSGIVDATTTGIFRILTTDEASNDGGGYVCEVTALIGHSVVASSGNDAAKKHTCSFSHVNRNDGTAVTTAVENVFSGASAATTPASRDIGVITASVGITSAYETRFRYNIDLTGSGVGDAEALVFITLYWSAYTTPPTIEAL